MKTQVLAITTKVLQSKKRFELKKTKLPSKGITEQELWNHNNSLTHHYLYLVSTFQIYVADISEIT